MLVFQHLQFGLDCMARVLFMAWMVALNLYLQNLHP